MMTLFLPYRRFLFFIVLILLISVRVNAEDRDLWILVDTEAQVLSVMKENTPIKVFRNISIGRNGADYDKRVGDDTTPLGSYRIGWVNENSRYHLFFGLSYPSMHDARRALFLDAINVETYRTLVRADIAKRVPPQNTMLGGGIGIHGLGKADSQIHRLMNWTHGCIALTNKQIDGLSRWIKKGIVVTIR